MSKNKSIQTIESLYQTGNEHYDSFAFDLVKDIKKIGTFEDIYTPMALYGAGINHFIENPNTPSKVWALMEAAFAKVGFSQEQSLYLLKAIIQYVEGSEWKEEKISDDTRDEFVIMFEADIERKEQALIALEPPQKNVKNLRKNLKDLLFQELEQLPEYLKELEAKDRANVILKLMPFVFPKVDSVHSSAGEPRTKKRNSYWG